MMILRYASKKQLKECIGQELRYTETSIVGPEYRANGDIYGSNRPSISGCGTKEFYAKVTMKDGKIARVT